MTSIPRSPGTGRIAIPAEALEAVARALYDVLRGDIDPLEWPDIGEWRQNYLRKEARAVAQALLAAWPGVELVLGAVVTDTYRDPGKIILPLPQEPDNGG